MSTPKRNYLRLPALLDQVDEPFRSVCIDLLVDNLLRMTTTRGSTHNHQAWPGGYLDHVREVMNIAVVLHDSFGTCRELPFTLSDALLVLFLHDLEKPWAFREVDGSWQRGPTFQGKADSQVFRMEKFAEYGVVLPEALERAVFLTEGEVGHYSSTERGMSPLAAFCHMCDVASARIWFDHPLERDDPWTGAVRSRTVTSTTEKEGV